MKAQWYPMFAGSPQALSQALEPPQVSACNLFAPASHPNSQLKPLDNCSTPSHGCDPHGKCPGFVLLLENLGFPATTLFCHRIRALSVDFVEAKSLLSQGGLGPAPAPWLLCHLGCVHDTSELPRCEG